MVRMTSADLASNPAMVRCLSPADRKALGAMTVAEAQDAYDARSESALLRQCEDWLVLHSYVKLTTGAAAAEALTRQNVPGMAQEGVFEASDGSRQGLQPKTDCRGIVGQNRIAGWFCHQPRSDGQFFFPDLVVFSYMWSRCLAIELKKPTGAIKWRPGQRIMVDFGVWHLVRTLDEFIAAIQEWERKADAASLAYWQAGINGQKEDGQ